MGTIRWIACLSVLALATTVRAERYALVVGVNECPDFRPAGGVNPRPLQAAEADATALAEALVANLGFARDKVQLLKGPAATYAGIKEAFERIGKAVRTEDTFVFFFSGHGTQIPDQAPFDEIETDGLDEALCPYDATDRKKNLIVDDELGQWLEALPAGRVTVILDCCHAGTGAKPTDDLAARYLPLPIEKAPGQGKKQPWRELRGSTKSIERRLTAFYACRPEQQAYERKLLEAEPPVRRGQFTYYLVEALQKAKPGAAPSIQQVFDHIAKCLDKHFNSGRTEPGERQEPLLEAGDPKAPIFAEKK